MHCWERIEFQTGSLGADSHSNKTEERSIPKLTWAQRVSHSLPTTSKLLDKMVTKTSMTATVSNYWLHSSMRFHDSLLSIRALNTSGQAFLLILFCISMLVLTLNGTPGEPISTQLVPLNHVCISPLINLWHLKLSLILGSIIWVSVHISRVWEVVKGRKERQVRESRGMRTCAQWLCYGAGESPKGPSLKSLDSGLSCIGRQRNL